MAKQHDELPTLDDFTESSLLDSITDDDDPQDPPVDEPDDLQDDPTDDPENPLSKKPIDDDDPKEPEPDDDPDDDPEPEPKKKTTSKKKDEPSDDPEEGTFWDDVENITGVQLEVDYGDVDPESPEGAAIREQALVERVENGIWSYIQERHPKVYKALEIEAAGGNISDIITPDYVDYSTITVDPENEAQQKKILMDYYMDVKNLSETKARRMVEADEDEEEEDSLFKAAESAIKERQEAQKEREDKLVEQQKAEAEKQKKQDEQVVGYIKNVTDQGKIGGFNLPKPEREKFFEFFTSTVQRNPNGGYMFAVPLTNDNFDQMMEQAYFSFKGGDVSKLIERRATTAKASTKKRTLKRAVKKVSSSSSSAEQDKKRAERDKLPTMDSFSAD